MSTSDIVSVVRSMRPMVCARVPLAPTETPPDVKASIMSMLAAKYFATITGALDVQPVAVAPLPSSQNHGGSSSDTDGPPTGGGGGQVASGKIVFMCRLVGSTLVAVQCFVSAEFVGCTVSSVQIEGNDIRRAQAPASAVKHVVDISSFLWDFHLGNLQVRYVTSFHRGAALTFVLLVRQNLFLRLSERSEVAWQDSGVALLSFSKPIGGLTAPLRAFANAHPPPRATIALAKHTIGLIEERGGPQVSTRQLARYMSNAEEDFGYSSLRYFNEPTTLFVTVGNELFEGILSKKSHAPKQKKPEFQCTLVVGVGGNKNTQARFFLIMSGVVIEKDPVTKVCCP